MSTIEKPPSAELKPGQLDVDSLPPYEVLDPILEAYVEQDRSLDEIASMGYEREIVARVIRHGRPGRVQAPPGAAGTEGHVARLRT